MISFKIYTLSAANLLVLMSDTIEVLINMAGL